MNQDKTDRTAVDHVELTVTELCRVCDLSIERVTRWVEVGLLEPVGEEPSQWRFVDVSISQLRLAQRLQHDLGVNDAGVALALELKQELDQLRARIRWLEGDQQDG